MKFEYKPYNYRPSNSEIIEDLQKVANKNSFSTMSMRQYAEFGRFDTSTISRRFGTWNNALQAANIETAQQFWTVEQLFENIEVVWRKKGRQPTRRDMDDKDFSSISSGAYLRKFGRWSVALEQFVSYVNQDDTFDESSIETLAEVTGHKTKRDINLRLRFKVLMRDNFRCSSCGASPAKDSSVELHIDHIIPWSRGDETVIDNLQTLCSKCNLGKSDLMLD